MEKNNINLKQVAVGAIGLLNNEPGSHFRGGCNALGPAVALFLTEFVKKHTISQTHNFIIISTWNCVQILPLPVIRLFNQTPGSETRDLLYKTPDIPPQRPICEFHIVFIKLLFVMFFRCVSFSSSSINFLLGPLRQ